MHEHSDTWLAKIDAARGLDAVISTILDTLPRRDDWCVEFGAWDGSLASNSRNLIVQRGYSAVLIESDKDRFHALQMKYSDNKQVIPLNQYVGFEAIDGLDALLAGTPIPRDFDFLSVDIDGNDYHTWNAVTAYQPKVVCIEFNNTISPEVSFVQPADPSVNQGSSLTALVELGKRKHYELIAVIGVNAFFVAQEYYPLFTITDNRIDALWVDRDQITYLFSGYDGRMFLRGSQNLPWHDIPLLESKIQHVPFYLRRYPYSTWRRVLYLGLHEPFSLLGKIARRIGRLRRH